METETAMPAKAKKAPRVTRVASPKPEKPKVDAKAAEKAAKEARLKAEEKAAEKEKAAAEKVKARAKVEAKLEPLAKEILHRLEMATKMDSKADDHRLSASLQFAEAKKMCDDNGINFKEWSAKHIPNQSYETIRQMVRVGASDDPKLALADMRKGTADRNKKLRAKKKIAASKPEQNIGRDPAGRATTPFQRVEAGLAEMPEGQVKELLASQVAQFGYQMLSDKEVKALKAAAPASAPSGKRGEEPWKPLLDGVMALPGKARADFLFELQEATGYKLVPAKDYDAYTATKKKDR